MIFQNSETSERDEESSGELFISSESFPDYSSEVNSSEESDFISVESSSKVASEDNSFESTYSESEASTEEESKEIQESSSDNNSEVTSYNGFNEPEGYIVSTSNGNVFETNCKDEEAISIMSELADIASKYNEVTIYYTDINQKYFFAFGTENIHKTASTIKAPYAAYILKSGADLSELIVMEEHHVSSGSGVMKNMEIGSEFTVKELISYMIRRSDNTAYKMLLERFGTNGFREYAKGIGIDFRLPSGGYTTCTIREMASFLLDIYYYEGTEEGDFLINQMKNCSYSLQIPKAVSHSVAHKFGFMDGGRAFHDMGIVYAPSPYIELIFTKIDSTVYDTQPFIEIGNLVESLNKKLSEKY